MKKLVSFICLMGLMLVACSGSENDTNYSKNVVGTEESSQNEMEKSENNDLDDFPIITLRILLPYNAMPDMNRLNQMDDQMNERANQYLKENNKEYRVKYETKQMEQEKLQENDISGADILCTWIGPEEVKDYYADLSPELHEGKLSKVYNSVPELYWERVNVNGSVYSLLATPPSVHLLAMENEAGQYEVPEELIGSVLTEWSDFLEETYSENNQIGFIMPPFSSSTECPLLAEYALNTRFQLVLPFLGIDLENPDGGVQCVYESDYVQKTQELLCRYIPKTDKEESAETALSLELASWSLSQGYDILDGSNISGSESEQIYSLQETTYATPQISGVKYYHTGISKDCTQKDLVYEFLCDVQTDTAMLDAVSQNDAGTIWWHLVPNALLMENNAQGIYTGTLEENQLIQEKRFDVAVSAPVPGFVFDSEPVQAEVDAINAFLYQGGIYNTLRSLVSQEKIPGYAAEFPYISDEIIESLYDLGMQKVIDEANRQVAEWKAIKGVTTN